jgi:2-(1,2-epoxy-1,2-dihydrophenyl)acetyl-CoA isomerase
MTAHSDTLLVTADEYGLVTVVMNRPTVLNAADSLMVDALRTLFEDLSNDDTSRCILISGAGRAFCAGRDLATAAVDEDVHDTIHNHVNPMLAAIFDCPKPTIAAVNGAAMGIGLGVALACDIVLAADNAKLSSPFAHLGMALDAGGHYFLPRLVGYHRAMEMAYTGDIVRGRQAAEWGLVNHSYAGAVLAERATALGRRIAAGSPRAQMGQKELMRRSLSMEYSEVCEAEAKLQHSLVGSPEYAEGLAAFREKRRPDFRSVNGIRTMGEAQ